MERIQINATAFFDNFDEFEKFWNSQTIESLKELDKSTNGISEFDAGDLNLYKNWISRSIYSTFWGADTEAQFVKQDIQKQLDKLKKTIVYSERYNQPFRVNTIYKDFGIVISIGNAKFFIIDGEKHLKDIKYANDYSDMSVGQMRALIGDVQVATTVPAIVSDNISVKSVKDEAQSAKSAMDEMERELKNLNNESSKELAELKAEVEAAKAKLQAKKEALMSELNKKKDELEEKMEKMNNQIFLLESQIYSIQCYLGETVNFSQVRKGRNASDNEPIVLHQKLRFLDEEMGRLCSLYELDDEELEMFEDFLAASPIALDTFVPNERCVALVKLSKTGKRLIPSEKITNMLETYRLYHGGMVAILIRNGENVYVGWTDDEKVKVTDDLILNMNKTETVPYEEKESETESERKRKEKEQKNIAKGIIEEVVSRVFIFNILQGIVDNSDVLPLPKGVSIAKQSEYVQFALADMWITDNRYGSFSDILKKCESGEVKRGDLILTVQNLLPEKKDWNGRYIGYRTWHNDRGRGDKNRTHDCRANDCCVYAINVVDSDKPTLITEYNIDGCGDSVYKTDGDGSSLVDSTKILRTYEYIQKHYFVSLKKSDSESGTARANFEVYPEEFINLNYMNSDWLNYAINNKNLGGWHVGGTHVDYAYGIRYLNMALQYVKEREGKEEALINDVDDTFTNTHKDWRVLLSEFKIANSIHSLNAKNRRKFIESV